MNFIINNHIFFNLIIFALILVFFVLIFKQAQSIKQRNKTKEARVLKEFSELTELDLKYRKVALSNYIRYYLFTSKQRAWFTISMLSALFFLSGGIFSIFLTDKDYIVLFCFSISYYLIFFLRVKQPSIEKQLEFWKEYLIKHPENHLKVLVPTENEAKNMDKAQKKLSVYLFITATLFLLLSMLSNI